ncbi:unnamed protein product [Amoebophrya sp. A25]|nr:unnamed protein product [Amoebophrya sp. A25]|eukprot:GSA25T00024032001.1
MEDQDDCELNIREVQVASRSKMGGAVNTWSLWPVLTIDRATRAIAHRVRQKRSRPLQAIAWQEHNFVYFSAMRSACFVLSDAGRQY